MIDPTICLQMYQDLIDLRYGHDKQRTLMISKNHPLLDKSLEMDKNLKLGTGGSATVYACLGQDGKNLAVKCMSKKCNNLRFRSDLVIFHRKYCCFNTTSFLSSDTLLLPQELVIHRRLQERASFQNYRILRMIAWYENAGCWCLVLERARTNLLQRTVLKIKNSGTPFCLKRAANYIRCIALALEQCHQAGVMHLDLKLENILLMGFQPASVKLSDFGSAAMAPLADGFRGTMNSAAPEVMLWAFTPRQRKLYNLPTPEPYGKEADLWSLGVITFELLTGKLLYQDTIADRVRVARGEVDLGKLDAIPVAKEFVCRLLRRRPSHRLSLEACQDHAFLIQ